MSAFRDPEAVERARGRLEGATGVFIDPNWESMFSHAANPDQAAVNFERWLLATGSPSTYLSMVVGAPRLGQLLGTILGGSQPLADSLIQNPELASIIFDPSERARQPSLEGLLQEGRMLLKTASSPSHALDRLRFLKQRWTLSIALNDLAGAWLQRQVWSAISVLAQSLCQLALESVWNQEDEPQILVIGFGKLGGEELNYSSDIDLAYVAPDGIDDFTDRRFSKICEAHTRAMTERMGRGQLYRVDLRLRPYGGAGPILRTMRAYEAYYELYAEPWEIQALMRSRPVAGPPDLAARWEAMREKWCFRAKWAENTVESMLDMRQRIEDLSDEGDLKRGRGGIRDVEFLVQILQLLHGQESPELRKRPTLVGLQALEDTSYLDHATAQMLREGYTFLRQLEHRLQMADDQQTHALPTTQEGQLALAKRMGEPNWVNLQGRLDKVREAIGNIYIERFRGRVEAGSGRGKVLDIVGADSMALASWFDVLDEKEAFYGALASSPESLVRVHKLIRRAPWLIRFFRESISLTEQIVSGEIEEGHDPAVRIRKIDPYAPPERIAAALKNALAERCTQWALAPHPYLAAQLGELYEATLRLIFVRLGIDFDVLALGSFASNDLGPDSDLDMVLLVSDQALHRDAERKGQEFLQFVDLLRRSGAPIEVDLRLRPDGGKGLLVRSYEALRQYDLEGMEMWERFALGQARLLTGSQSGLDLTRKCTYGMPLTPERLRDLVRMKRRIETERVQPTQVHRNVKLGKGGLNDIEWTIRLTEMRYPLATKAMSTSDSRERIRNLGQSGLFNAVEVGQLQEARDLCLSLRTWLTLQGIRDDLLPENPDRLQRLAEAAGFETGNGLLQRFQKTAHVIRGLFEDTLERLRA